MSVTTRMQLNETDKQVELIKIKRMIKDLETAHGRGTSMISLFIPPGGNGQLVRVCKMLKEEYAVSANIKSRV